MRYSLWRRRDDLRFFTGFIVQSMLTQVIITYAS